MRVHQNIIIDGVDLGERQSRKHSKFCNEGKWNTFIDPLLPDGDTFVEMGSNAGMFLKLAQQKYKYVVGVEQNVINYEVSKEYLKDTNCKIINQLMTEGWDFDQIPVADITLLANFHYHIKWQDWLYYVDRLRYKTCYVLVVSAAIPRGKRVHWKPASDVNTIRLLFKDWEEVASILRVSKVDDPHPRNMYSLLFKSELRSKPINSIWNPRKGISNNPKYTNKVVKEKPELYESVKKIGLINPILVNTDNALIEGGHRLEMLKSLGYKNVIVRYV